MSWPLRRISLSSPSWMRESSPTINKTSMTIGSMEAWFSMVRETGLEPVRFHQPRDFKSRAYTGFATLAWTRNGWCANVFCKLGGAYGILARGDDFTPFGGGCLALSPEAVGNGRFLSQFLRNSYTLAFFGIFAFAFIRTNASFLRTHLGNSLLERTIQIGF